MTTVVLPLFNEAESLATLHQELARAFGDLPVEFIFVDDGSTDGSWRAVRELAAADPASGPYASAATSARPPR